MLEAGVCAAAGSALTIAALLLLGTPEPRTQIVYVYDIPSDRVPNKRIATGFNYLPFEPECTGPNGEDCNDPSRAYKPGKAVAPKGP